MLPGVTRFQVCSGSRHRLNCNIVMFNSLDIQDNLVVKIPAYIAQNYTLAECICCEDNSDITEHCVVTDKYPWIDIASSELSTQAGTHTYRLKFAGVYNNDEIHLYFGYIIQDDDPDKPYVYMKEDEE